MSKRECSNYVKKARKLSYYGVGIAEYHGEGNLTLKDGATVSCRFEAGQLAAGDVLLLCDFIPAIDSCLSVSADKFEGTTTKDFRISGEVINEVPYLPDLPRGRSGKWAAFRLREMSVQMVDNSDGATKARFGITNFEFTGTQGYRTDNGSCLILPLALKYQDSATDLSLIPLQNYSRIIQRIKTLKGIDVTCEAVANITKDEGITRLTDTIDDLCYLLSIARGTKVQWIYRDLYDEAGKLIQRTHYLNITKPFCGLSIIDPRAAASNETKNFIEQTYPIYREKKESWGLNQGTIDAYLDAKAERDYLQMRGVKLAVAIEMLKSVFLDLPDSPVKEYVIDEKDFKENLAPFISTAAVNVLKDMNVENQYRDAICNSKKIEGLNRRSFGHVLRKLCKHIGLQGEGDEQLFIACRNSLVHNGRFYCERAKPEERRKCKPLPSRVDEYFFLVSFLDRIFLKLLGYSGLYMNWCLPGSPSKEKV